MVVIQANEFPVLARGVATQKKVNSRRGINVDLRLGRGQSQIKASENSANRLSLRNSGQVTTTLLVFSALTAE
jgi:hypothetical protein